VSVALQADLLIQCKIQQKTQKTVEHS